MIERNPSDPHAAVSYAEAVETVAAYSSTLSPPASMQSVSLLEALHRVLAQPLLADRDQPPFPRATRDGYACQAGDLAAEAPLQVIGTLRAGEAWSGAPLEAGQTVEIMTGAPLPPGADCVVMVEHVELTSYGFRLLAGRRVRVGDNYNPPGSEARAGELLIASGTRLTPSHLAASAAMGAATLSVYRRPRVAILSTGDELVPLDATPLPFQIRNSNTYSLAAQVLALGAEPVLLPIAGDTESALEEALSLARQEKPDLLLLSGGVSMGKFDLVEPVLAAHGARFFFTGVRIQPGKPLVFGELPAAEGEPLPLFGLPGNPLSTMVTFALFVAPGLAALAGEPGFAPRFAQATLGAPISRKPALRRFLPAVLAGSADTVTATPVAWQGSGDLAAAAKANCFLVVPEAAADGEQALSPGNTVGVLLA
ncbi:MAG TPA: gephyrin-like molybdotransferase Glp [Acidobacteriaceae bacterium]